MNDSQNDVTTSATNDSSKKSFVSKAPLVFVVVLFVVAILFGGEVSDRGLLPLVRFISLLMLALAIFTTVMVNRYCAYSVNRWRTGQAAAGCIAFGGGFVWSATAFGMGFIFFMLGTLLCALLAFKVMERNTNRFLSRRKPQA